MPTNNQIEDAARRMRELVHSDIVNQIRHANEAKTRLMIIDTVLDILGWSKGEYEPEMTTELGNYTDYRLTIEGQGRLIVEAKRIGLFNALPRTLQKPEFQNSFLYRNYGPEMKSLLEQCQSYCSQCGIPYALATTGEIWVVLHGFKLGTAWGTLKSYVFHSLNDILQRFGDFYGLIFREAVKNNSLEEKLGEAISITPHTAILPREHIKYFPNIEQPAHQQIISAFFNHFMTDITDSSQEKMLQQCYVENNEINEFSRDLQQILQYDASLEEVEIIQSDLDQSTLEEAIRIQSTFVNPKTILLVGNVGVGKSTFVYRFMKYDARPKRYICTTINLINRATKNITSDYEEEQRLAESVLSELAKEFQNKIDPYSPEIMKGCFDNKIGRFKKQRQTLLKLNPEQYALEEEAFLYELSKNKYEYLVGYINYVRKKGNKIWIAFDNVDRGSASYQQFIYSFAHQLGADARCVTLIALRQDTFLEAQEAGFLDVRTTDITFQLHAPEFRQIISKRRKYVDKIIQNNDIPHLFKPYIQLIKLLNWHVNRLLLDDDFIRLFITTFSLNNIRYGLAMLRDYYASPHSTFHDFYKIHQDDANLDSSIKIHYQTEQNRFIQALMLENRWSYEEKQSGMFNVYSVDRFEKVSHFIVLRILAYLTLKINFTSLKHSIKYEKVLNDFVSLGYQSRHLNRAMINMLYAGLIVSPTLAIPSMETKIEIPDPLPLETKIALSAKGYYYLQQLAANDYYQTRVVEGTIWYNEDFAKKYINCLQDVLEVQSNGTDDTLLATEAREIFISYLKWSLFDDSQNTNIRRTNNDWAQLMDNLVKQKVFGEVFGEALSKLQNSNHNLLLDEFYDAYQFDIEQYDNKNKRQIKDKKIQEQLPLFEENTVDIEQAIQKAVTSLKPMPLGSKVRRSSYIIPVLWALEIAFRAGLGPISPKYIAQIIRNHAEEFITVRGVTTFLNNQKKNDSEYKYLWREEPEGYFIINSFGQNSLDSHLIETSNSNEEQ